SFRLFINVEKSSSVPVGDNISLHELVLVLFSDTWDVHSLVSRAANFSTCITFLSHVKLMVLLQPFIQVNKTIGLALCL
uniref:Uncharacterized protein n=1 Tax=Aegilops tauschii subsp. strangulata TaxID=200361 RepID=A0A453H9Y0_AEGTS